MYHSVKNSVVIQSSPQRVYECCATPEHWPKVMRTCVGARQTRVRDDEDEFIMELQVDNALGQTTMQSKRRYSRDSLSLEFVMLSTPPHFAEMRGSWRVLPHIHGAELEVVHEFRATDEGEAARDALVRAVFENTSTVLGELKRWAEGHVAS